MKFRLLAEHWIFDQIMSPGTEIGDDTAWPLPDNFEPSPDMEGLDSEGKSALEDLKEKLYGKEAAKKDHAITAHPADTNSPGQTRPATPSQSKDDPGVRPKKPNEEQSPKG